MKIKAQFGMVMSLDKCIGCHTCSMSCNNTWTNREGAEYMWWNNVETKPGIGYPRLWENQEQRKGGWTLRNGKLELKAGGRIKKLLNIFYNPDLVPIDDYYEPWTYDYDHLISSPAKKHQPVARPKSILTGEYMELNWGPNWEDDLAGVHVTGQKDPNRRGLEEAVRLEFEKVFMMYLPRICEHCINPACLASCPSGAIYKRDEDGIVLVNQDACRSWRFCMTGCPYKKTYFNWKSRKAEKCIFCYPLIETGQPTVCSETCVGRLRYIGIVLYDADRIKEVASITDPKDLYKAQLSLFLNPNDPEIIARAKKDGIAEDWIEAAQRSPVYKLLIEYGVALPLHPEYRTLPMVWYLPPLSPIVKTSDSTDASVLFAHVDNMRIPVAYLANMLTAGDAGAIRHSLKSLIGLRQYIRNVNILKKTGDEILNGTNLSEDKAVGLYRLLSIAKYSDRFVIPASHKERTGNMHVYQGSSGFENASECSGCHTWHED